MGCITFEQLNIYFQYKTDRLRKKSQNKSIKEKKKRMTENQVSYIFHIHIG